MPAHLRSHCSDANCKTQKRINPDQLLPPSKKLKRPLFDPKILPQEVYCKIFSMLDPRDLCRVAQTCKYFKLFIDDKNIWKIKYKQVFEYDLPLIHPAPGEFSFVTPTGCDDNLWKDSFRQLYKGIHVKPNYDSPPDSTIQYFTSIHAALSSLTTEQIYNNLGPIIFIHPGFYKEGNITVVSNLQLIGCGPGNIALSVIIEGDLNNTITFSSGAVKAYVGFMTLKFLANCFYERSHCYTVNIFSNCSPVIDHTIIQNDNSEGAAVRVMGDGSSPLLKYCDIRDCHCVGLYITDSAKGLYHDNNIYKNRDAGVWVTNFADPSMARNRIHNGFNVGIHASNFGQGYFEKNDICNNHMEGIRVRTGADPTVDHCNIHNGQFTGIVVSESGRGKFFNNKIYANGCGEIKICSLGNPVIRKNEIYSSLLCGISIFNHGMGKIEYNNMYDIKDSGLFISSHSDPVVRNNTIHHVKDSGVAVYGEGKGLFEHNIIHDIDRSGVRINRDSDPTFKNNVIFNCHTSGVNICHGGKGLFQDNDIYGNALSGVRISSHNNPKLRFNRIFNCGGSGISITEHGATATLEYNEVYKNMHEGLRLASGANATTIGNRFIDNNIADDADDLVDNVNDQDDL